MVTLQLIWAWCRKYWGIVLAIAGFVVGYALFRRGDVDIGKILDGIRDDHKKDVDSIKRKDDEIKREKDRLKREEEEKLAELDKKYSNLKKDLDAETRKRADEIMSDTKSDPDELAKRLAAVLGSKKL